MGSTTVYNMNTFPFFRNLNEPQLCNGTCTNYTLQTLENNPIYFNLSSTFDSFNLTNFYDQSLNSITKSVYFVAQRPLSSRSNCPYVYEAFKMKFLLIHMILPVGIPNIIYEPPITF